MLTASPSERQAVHIQSADRPGVITVWAYFTLLEVQVERRLPGLLLQHPDRKIPDGEVLWLEPWSSSGTLDRASDSPPKSRGARWTWTAWGTCSWFLFIWWILLRKVSPEARRRRSHSWKPLARACGGDPVFVFVGKWNDETLEKIIWKVNAPSTFKLLLSHLAMISLNLSSFT